MKLTPRLAEALTNLRTNRDFAVVLEGLKEHEVEETKRCVDGDGAIHLRASGAVKAIQIWLTFFDKAPEDFEKFKNQQTSGKNTR